MRTPPISTARSPDPVLAVAVASAYVPSAWSIAARRSPPISSAVSAIVTTPPVPSRGSCGHHQEQLAHVGVARVERDLDVAAQHVAGGQGGELLRHGAAAGGGGP